MPGYVDVVDPYQVSGWALQAGSHTPDRVVIYVDDKEVAQIPCNLFRSDLQNAGLGSGMGGFRYVFAEQNGSISPQKVVIRALSSGEILPYSTGSVVARADVTGITETLLGSATFMEPVYAVDLFEVTSIAAGIDDSPSRGVLRIGEWGKFSVTGLALAPPDAVLGLVPATDSEGVAVSQFKSSEAPLAGLPEGASKLREIRCEVTLFAPSQKPYIALRLVDLNLKSSASWGSPINPMTMTCLPLGYNWITTPPDAKNIARVWDFTSWQNFCRAGLTTAYQMHSLASEFLIEQKGITILDWGIGCGRVAVPLKRCLNPNARVIGVDVDRVNIDWCRENLPDIEVSVSDFFPPLDFETCSFDMVYGMSVMTHLTEGAQYVWLKELHRILKPGGICALTIHGEYAILRHFGYMAESSFLDLLIKPLRLNGISDIMNDANLGPQLDMTGYYRSTYQLRRQVEEKWSKFFEVIAYYPAAFFVDHDIVVMRKV
jgi:SAM-dependent methyltransferase